MRERRSFLKNSMFLSVGATVGIFDGFLQKRTIHTESNLKTSWATWAKNGCGKRMSFLQDISIFEKKEIDVDFSKFTSHWGTPVFFEKEQVVARPLWKHWDGNARPMDYSIFFWEKKEGTWQYNRSLHSSDIIALNSFMTEYTEGENCVPRLHTTQQQLKTAMGYIDIKTRTVKSDLVSTLKLQQNNGFVVLRTYLSSVVNNLIF